MSLKATIYWSYKMRIIFLLIVFYFPSWVFAGAGGDIILPPSFDIIPSTFTQSSLGLNATAFTQSSQELNATAFTQSSLELNATALQSAYNLQTFTIINGLTYDCSVFNAKGSAYLQALVIQLPMAPIQMIRVFCSLALTKSIKIFASALGWTKA